jgi:hypothetical protein
MFKDGPIELPLVTLGKGSFFGFWSCVAPNALFNFHVKADSFGSLQSLERETLQNYRNVHAEIDHGLQRAELWVESNGGVPVCDFQIYVPKKSPGYLKKKLTDAIK